MNFELTRCRIEQIAQPSIRQTFGPWLPWFVVGDPQNLKWFLKISGKHAMAIEIDVERTDQEIDAHIRSEIARQSRLLMNSSRLSGRTSPVSISR